MSYNIQIPARKREEDLVRMQSALESINDFIELEQSKIQLISKKDYFDQQFDQLEAQAIQTLLTTKLMMNSLNSIHKRTLLLSFTKIQESQNNKPFMDLLDLNTPKSIILSDCVRNDILTLQVTSPQNKIIDKVYYGKENLLPSSVKQELPKIKGKQRYLQLNQSQMIHQHSCEEKCKPFSIITPLIKPNHHAKTDSKPINNLHSLFAQNLEINPILLEQTQQEGRILQLCNQMMEKQKLKINLTQPTNISDSDSDDDDASNRIRQYEQNAYLLSRNSSFSQQNSNLIEKKTQNLNIKNQIKEFILGIIVGIGISYSLFYILINLL